MSENYIIVCDPDPGGHRPGRPPAREGDVLSAAMARQREPAGVLLLPVHAPHLPQRGGTGSIASTAYQRHVYGSEGVTFEFLKFAKGCTAPVCMPSDVAQIDWIARIAVDDDSDGFCRLLLAAEETSHGFLRVMNSEPTRRDGEFLRGSTIVHGTERCFGAVCLAGACVGVRVLWFALTVLPR